MRRSMHPAENHLQGAGLWFSQNPGPVHARPGPQRQERTVARSARRTRVSTESACSRTAATIFSALARA